MRIRMSIDWSTHDGLVFGDRVPLASILFDRFHLLRDLGDALNANLSVERKGSRSLLLAANKRLRRAFRLKECFGQL